VAVAVAVCGAALLTAQSPQWVGSVASGLMLGGLGNGGWHGVRHLGDFWGQAALISGVFMKAVAVLLAVERSTAAWGRFGVVRAIHELITPVSGVLVVGWSHLVRGGLGAAQPGLNPSGLSF
jgi:hypothetical protein